MKALLRYSAKKLFLPGLFPRNSPKILGTITAQKMKFSIKDFFNKCDQILRKLRIWSHLLKKSLMENFVFCAVNFPAEHLQRFALNIEH